jgi:hypothetical protein
MPAVNKRWVRIEDEIRKILDDIIPTVYVHGQQAVKADEYIEIAPPESSIDAEYVSISGLQTHQSTYTFEISIYKKYDANNVQGTRWRIMDIAQDIIDNLFTKWKLDPTLSGLILQPERIERVSGPRLTTTRDTDRIDWTVTFLITLMGEVVGI